LKELEAADHPKVHESEKYSSFLKDVAIEVMNRKDVRESQKKEILRMEAALKNLKSHQKFIEEQLNDYNGYLSSCRENISEKFKVKKKPVKMSYKELVKKNVILDSEVPTISRGGCKFFISMPDSTTINIECKIQGISVGTMVIELEDLLERKDNNIQKYETEKKVTLHVPSTISLINEKFLSAHK